MSTTFYRLTCRCHLCGREQGPFDGGSYGEVVELARDADWTLVLDEEGEWRMRCPTCTAEIDAAQEALMQGDTAL